MKKYARKDANMSAGRLQANTTARANGLSDDRRAAIGAATLASTATIKAVTQTTLRAMPPVVAARPRYGECRDHERTTGDGCDC